MDRHDLDRVSGVDGRRLLVFAGEKDQVEVAHVGIERVVGGCLAELGDVFGEPADVGRGVRPRRKIIGLFHQLEEEVTHVDLPRHRSDPLEQRLQRGRRGPRQRDEIARIANHAEHRDHVPDLGKVVESMAADDHVR